MQVIVQTLADTTDEDAQNMAEVIDELLLRICKPEGTLIAHICLKTSK